MGRAAGLGVLVALLVVAAAGAATDPLARFPRCFGAASRDLLRPCHNPRLRLMVRPSWERSLLTPGYPCTPGEGFGDARDVSGGRLTICEFGVAAARARTTAAVIGDSHAMAWRGAVAGALRRLRWHGISMARTACAYSTARTAQPRARALGCQRFNRRVRRWLAAHPEVEVVIFAHQSEGDYPTIPIGRRSPSASALLGYMRAWRRLPASVRQVIAIRDNPRAPYIAPKCLRDARRAGRPPGLACAQRREIALRPDEYPVAVRRLRSWRYRLADLTRFMCDTWRCFPVVGGARVFKDGDHLSRTFSETLGPYLARRVRAILRSSHHRDLMTG